MQCKSFFKDVAGDMADFDSPFDTLATLAGVLSSDEEMVYSRSKFSLFLIIFKYKSLSMAPNLNHDPDNSEHDLF